MVLETRRRNDTGGELPLPVTTPRYPDNRLPGAWPGIERSPPSFTRDPERDPATALKDLQDKVRIDAQRRVDPETAARLINQLRRYGPSIDLADRGTSNDDLMASITPEQEREWYQAQGFNDQEVKAFRKGARFAGMVNPCGTFFSNTISYMITPAISAATTPWTGAGLAVAYSLISPTLNALQQSGVVVLCENIREKAGFSIKLTKNINDKNRVLDLAPKLQQKAAGLVGAGIFFRDMTQKLYPEGDRDSPGYAAELRGRIAGASKEQRESLKAAVAALQAAESEMHELQEDLLVADSSRAKQRVGNKWQIGPRAIRSTASSLVGLGRGLTKEQLQAALETSPNGLAGTVLRAAQYSAGTGVFIQAAISLALFGAQSIAAGQDICNQHDYNNRMNLLYGDILKEDASRSPTQQVTAADIDEDKLRGMILTRDQALVARMGAILASKIKKVRKDIEKLQNQREDGMPEEMPDTTALAEDGDPEMPGAYPPEAATDQPTSIGEAELQTTLAQMEADPALPGTYPPEAATDQPTSIGEAELRRTLAQMEAELEKLKAGDLDQLEPDGICAGLLVGNMNAFFSKFLLADIVAKYRKPGEMVAQTMQRYGQAFHLLFLGSAAASWIGQVANAAVGGSSHASVRQIVGLAVAGGVIGSVGAATQSEAVVTKNFKRANEEGDQAVSPLSQLGQGMLALPNMVKGNREAPKATRAVTNALHEMVGTLDLAAQCAAALHPPEDDEAGGTPEDDEADGTENT